ncbi:MAG TPA: hypothetical protein VGJ81_10610 [Thermoanaerobaculia bacterium]|jgi:hypothetical protein
MKKLALLSSVLLLVTMAAYSAAVVKSKSNISNNRAAMCHGTVTGEAGHQKLACTTCPDGKCDVHTVDVKRGGTKSWCSCTKEEPADCHVVLHTAPGGTTSAQCSQTACEKPKTCKETESKTGITCDCR